MQGDSWLQVGHWVHWPKKNAMDMLTEHSATSYLYFWSEIHTQAATSIMEALNLQFWKQSETRRVINASIVSVP